jgi:hypothetical protein
MVAERNTKRRKDGKESCGTALPLSILSSFSFPSATVGLAAAEGRAASFAFLAAISFSSLSVESVRVSLCDTTVCHDVPEVTKSCRFCIDSPCCIVYY